MTAYKAVEMIDGGFAVLDKPDFPFPDPTPEMLESPEFNKVWDCIKTWDINVPGAYCGYMSAIGNHVRAIIDSLK